MPRLQSATPLLSVKIYKTIGRSPTDGASVRYQNKDNMIDLTPFLGDGSSVRTSKSTREPAGTFSISFADQPENNKGILEAIYGLIEPMDIVEIRMWGGIGATPAVLPIKMRGFVSDISRQQIMGDDGKPSRTVTISGQDYGKIWQTYQVVYLAAYAEGDYLLTSLSFFELFGGTVRTVLKSSEFIGVIVDNVNKHMAAFKPANLPAEIPFALNMGKLVAVKHGVIQMTNMNLQGSLFELCRNHGDVGNWNELFTQDYESGVEVVYRPIPAMFLSPPRKLIQGDAPEPEFVFIDSSLIQSFSSSRSDARVANFFWVENARYDQITDMQRKLASIPVDNSKVFLKGYPNSDPKYYGTRPMNASTQQGEDNVDTFNGGLDKAAKEKRDVLLVSWLDIRRQQLMDMNKDNSAYERGSATVKGGIMRSDGVEHLKAGDYATFGFGDLYSDAYITQIDDVFVPFQSYTATLTYERGTGFVDRIASSASPWLFEQVNNND